MEALLHCSELLLDFALIDCFHAELDSFCTLLPTDYHFTTREAMQEGIDKGEFIEHAEFSGNMYGTR